MLTLKSPPQHASPLSRKPRPTPRPAEQIGPAHPVVTIEYCVPGNHERRARRLAEDVSRTFGVGCRLLPSRGGVFEVTVGDRLVFSKRATRRFPDHDEIFYHVKHRG